MHKILTPLIIIVCFLVGFSIARGALSKIYVDLKNDRSNSDVIIENGCNEECKKEIASEVSRAIATLSATPKNILLASPTPSAISPKPPDSYIQISGSGETQSTQWIDVPGSDFSFDVKNDFGKGARFAWEGFLRIKDANGTAYARIYDVTHLIGVDGSEISVANKGDFTRANSSNMNFWSGRNVYRVQIKSLNTFNVEYTGGKIRVSY